MFHDVDYRVRVTEMYSLIDIIGFSCMLTGHYTFVDFVHVKGIGQTRETAHFLHLEFMHTMV